MFDWVEKVNWLLLFAWGLGITCAVGTIAAFLIDNVNSVQWLTATLVCYGIARFELAAGAPNRTIEDDDDYTV